MMALAVGILNFYGLLDLRPLRALDPVVNFSGQQRLQATFGHSGWFAEYVVMSMAWLGTVLIAFRRVRLGIALVIALLIVAQFGLILTYQRGGWTRARVPAADDLAVDFLHLFKPFSAQSSSQYSGQPAFRDLVRRSLPKVALAVPLTIGIALVVFLAVASLGWFGAEWRLGASSYAERFGSLFDTSNRSMYLSTGLKLGRLHPVLGAGSESFAYTYWSEYLRPGGAFYGQGDPLPVLYGSAHNIYLQTLTGKGLVGLALLLSLMGYVVIGGIRILLRQADLPKPIVLILLATIGSTLGVACYGVVQEVFYIQSIQYVVFATFGIAGSLAEPWLHLRSAPCAGSPSPSRCCSSSISGSSTATRTHARSLVLAGSGARRQRARHHRTGLARHALPLVRCSRVSRSAVLGEVDHGAGAIALERPAERRDSCQRPHDRSRRLSRSQLARAEVSVAAIAVVHAIALRRVARGSPLAGARRHASARGDGGDVFSSAQRGERPATPDIEEPRDHAPHRVRRVEQTHV